jgi:hypothetical protein
MEKIKVAVAQQIVGRCFVHWKVFLSHLNNYQLDLLERTILPIVVPVVIFPLRVKLVLDEKGSFP